MTTPSQADVFGTSAWTTGTAGLTARFSNVLRKYGIVPDSATMAQYGIGNLFDPSQAANALANPDSIYNQLGRSRDTGFASQMHQANSHGGLFSGAAKNSSDQVGRDYATNVGRAGQDELDALLGLEGEAGGLYQTIFGDLLNRPVAADPTVYPEPDPAAKQVYAPIGTSTPTTVHDEGSAALAQRAPIRNAALAKKATTPKFSTTMGRY